MANDESSLTGMKQFLELLPDTVLIVNKEGFIEDLLIISLKYLCSLRLNSKKGKLSRELFSYKNLRGNSGNELLNAFLDTMKNP